MRGFLPLLFSGALAVARLCAAAVGRQLEACNIVWDVPSKSSADSMPLSGHNLGLILLRFGEPVFAQTSRTYPVSRCSGLRRRNVREVASGQVSARKNASGLFL
jgi:hypothetical protein